MITLRGPVSLAEDRAERLDRVLWHIEGHLAGDLSLAALAGVACYSPEHLLRVFQRAFGETPQHYVTRVRAENALNYLMYCPLRSITEIATESGFSTPSYFSTAFRKWVGVSPQEWKDFAYRGNCRFWDDSGLLLLPEGSRAAQIARNYRRHEMPELAPEDVTVVDTEPQRIAVLRSIGGYTPSALRKTWLTFYRWANGRGLWRRAGSPFGVLRSNPLVTDPQRCLYYAAVPVDDTFVEDGSVRALEVEANTYAMCRFRISGHQIGERDLVSVYLRLYHSWMEHAGLEPYHLRSVEIMPDAFPAVSLKGHSMTVGVPVRPARIYPVENG